MQNNQQNNQQNSGQNSGVAPLRKDLKNFGLIWAAIFFVIAVLPVFHGSFPRLWALLVSFIFSSISLSYPEIYDRIKFYQAWIKFGEIVGKINSKIIITILFYFIFVPIGLVLKIFRKDLLSKKLNKSSPSYFIDRITQAGDMKNQF